MLYNIAEPDKAYDKRHHLLNLLSRMKLPTFIKWTSPFSSSGLFGVFFPFLSKFFYRTSCKQTENLIRHCSLWRLILACTICLCPTKRTLLWVKYFCCICYSHQFYCFFIELNNGWIKSGFNHMNRHGVCHMWDRNGYDEKQFFCYGKD